MSYTIFNKCKIDKSRVPKCYAMTTNLRLKNPTCRTYTFKRVLSYVFNQINNSIMVLIKTVGQKNKNPRLRDLAAKNSRIRDAKKHKKTRFRDSFKTPPRFRDWNKNFRDPEFSGYHSPPLQLIDQSERAHWFGYYIKMHRSVSKGRRDLLLFKMPMQEAIFMEICSICTFQVKFWSIYTPRDFVNSTCFIVVVNGKRRESIKRI